MRYKPCSLILANQLASTRTQKFISYILYFTQLGQKSAQIKVQDVLNNCLLFKRNKVLAIQLCILLKQDSACALRESLLFNIKCSGSCLIALKLTVLISLKSKLQSFFVLELYCISLLRHNAQKIVLVMLRDSNRFSNLTGLVI